MAVARRRLLSAGAAVAITVAASSCRSGTTTTSRPAPPDPRPAGSPSPTTSTPARVAPAFVGQPPPGSLYYGASVPHGRSLRAWEKRLGNRLALHRSYFIPDHNEAVQLVHRCRQDLRQGRLPHVSTKPLGTWREVAAGTRDPWLTSMLRPLGELGGPVFLTLHHEPENDAGPPGMRPPDFVAMQQRLIRMARELAPSVTVVPVLQSWTFDPRRDDVDPAAWVVREAAVHGLDLYNPWSPTNGKTWRSFGSKADEVVGWFDGAPLVIAEYGCREDPDIPGLAADWLRHAVDYARSHNIVSMSYFNSGVGASDGTWRLSRRMEKAFAELLAADWVVRPQV